jgi:hypothetical protein
MLRVVSVMLPAILGGIAPAEAEQAGWSAGVAKVVVTPSESIWMAGYGARDHPSEGVLHDLWAKALVLQDPGGQRAALVTLDICGIDRSLSLEIRERIKERYGLARAEVVLACSHTHCGPVVGTNLITMYPLDTLQRERVAGYTGILRDRVVDVVGEAIERNEPVALSWDIGRCAFAVNRRNNDQSTVPELRERLALAGPDDHDVPVLRVATPEGVIKAVAFGYACHCTTLSFYQLNGDYAGFAQIALETAHPGAVALFWAGCGADQNPLPRGTPELAERYGNDLARSVDDVLARPMNPVRGPLRVADEEIALAFAEIPTKEEWTRRAGSENRFEAARAKVLLETIERDGGLSTTYPYPVLIWRFGDSLDWVFLGGEVVVDYAHRIKRNLGSDRTWVAAYCNDVMAYIPSLRVLKEGGYEGGGAMVYYGLPAVWSGKVEDQVIEAVRRLARPATSPTTRSP